MTPDELRANLLALNPLGLTQRRLAALLGRAERTVRHWVAGTRNISPEVAILIRLLAAGKLTIAEVEAARGEPMKGIKGDKGIRERG
jgi:transcriptional regulator with XRE-family HTH domain